MSIAASHHLHIHLHLPHRKLTSSIRIQSVKRAHQPDSSPERRDDGHRHASGSLLKCPPINQHRDWQHPAQHRQPAVQSILREPQSSTASDIPFHGAVRQSPADDTPQEESRAGDEVEEAADEGGSEVEAGVEDFAGGGEEAVLEDGEEATRYVLSCQPLPGQLLVWQVHTHRKTLGYNHCRKIRTGLNMARTSRREERRGTPSPSPSASLFFTSGTKNSESTRPNPAMPTCTQKMTRQWAKVTTKPPIHGPYPSSTASIRENPRERMPTNRRPRYRPSHEEPNRRPPNLLHHNQLYHTHTRTHSQRDKRSYIPPQKYPPG